MAKVHLAKPLDDQPACRRMWRAEITTVLAEVTCARCLKMRADAQAREAARG